MKPEHRSRYADLLSDPSDEALDKLIQELDAGYAAPPRPDDLSWEAAQQYLTSTSWSTSNEVLPLLPVRPLRRRVLRSKKVVFLAVAAIVMITVLSVALLNVIAPSHFQHNQPALAGADAQLLQHLVMDKGTPPNIRQLFQSRQFTPVSLPSNTYNVHIQSVYADANNVILLYTAAMSAWEAATFPGGSKSFDSPGPENEPVLTVKTSTGQMLPEIVERVDMGKEPVGLQSSKNKQFAILGYYDASVVQGDPTQLTLTAALSKLVSPSQERIGEFTTPVHTEKKAINVHQTAFSNGQAFTLDRVVMTSTEARFYYDYQGPLADSNNSGKLTGGGALSIAGKTYDRNPIPDDNSGEVYGWFGPNTGYPNYVSFHETLLDQTGAWVFTEKAVDLESPYSHFTWQFAFTVS